MLNTRSSNRIHALTIDVEDWHTGIPVDEMSVDCCENRLRGQMDVLLQLLDESGAKGTFFWLGELAEKYPDLVRTVLENGHRIGCHGWFHNFVNRIAPGVLRRDLSNTKNLLQDITGSDVFSHRAPYFSISMDSLWILDLLVDLGFRIDSSIFPVRNWRYGIPGFPDEIQQVLTRKGSLWLAPISIRRIARVSIPVSGGAYFRIYPYSFTRSNLRWLEDRGRSGVFYIHPWEIDPGQPRIDFDLRAKLTHYANLSSCIGKLRRLLSEFQFQPLEDIVERLQEQRKTSGGIGSSDNHHLSVSLHKRNHIGTDYLTGRRCKAQEKCLKQLDITGKVILDIGTRDGALLERIMQNLNPRTVIGLDVDSKCFSVMNKDDDVLLLQANTESIPLAHNSVDVVTCTSTYKHVWDVRAMLTECSRTLKPGGFLSLVEVTPFGILVGSLSGRFLQGTVHRSSNISNLCKELAESGFDVIEKRKFAVPFKAPGLRRIEGFMNGIGLGRLMFYQSILGKVVTPPFHSTSDST